MSFEMAEPGGVFPTYHPTGNDSEAQKVLRLGEVEYNRQKLRQALKWISDNPSDFTSLTLSRMALFWFPRTLTPGQSVVIWLITGLAFIGLLLAPLRGFIISIW